MEPESTNTGAPASGLVDHLRATLEAALTDARENGEEARRHALLAQQYADKEVQSLRTAELVRDLLLQHGVSAPSAEVDVRLADGTAVQAKAPQPHPADEMPGNTRQAVFRVLAKANGPLTTGDIVDGVHGLGITAQDATIRSVISKLADSDQIRKVRRGLYEIKGGTTYVVKHHRDGTTVAGYYRPSQIASARIYTPTAYEFMTEAGLADEEEEPEEELMFPTGSDCEIAAKAPESLSAPSGADDQEPVALDRFEQLSTEEKFQMSREHEEAHRENQAPDGEENSP